MIRAFTRQEITDIFRKARRILRHPGLDILIVPKNFDIARLLVITPKKIGNAPERNRVRRRIKAIWHEAQLDQQPYDCIVIVKQPGVELSFEVLKQLVLDTFYTIQNRPTQ
ncbi:MAG TPA: ribonuclease P protein component [Candidatus Babeliales bacterium]|nr:ribonuclease P protein component [Candidatus Babeliales bacterium]